MSPAQAAQLAVLAWPWRLRALAISVLAFAVAAASVFAAPQLAARAAFTLLGPVIGLAWSVLCVASWFHPETGSLSPKSRFVGKLPLWLQSVLRWYASIFLALFLVFCLVAWPAFSLSALWHLVK